jgi:hypothetical protein
MQYRSRCNIFNSFGNALLFRYIYKGRAVKISANIAFLFYKEIYMKYLLLYYNSEHRKMRAKQQHVCKEMNQYNYDQYQPEMDSKFRHRVDIRSEVQVEIAF